MNSPFVNETARLRPKAPWHSLRYLNRRFTTLFGALLLLETAEMFSILGERSSTSTTSGDGSLNCLIRPKPGAV